MNEKQKTIRAIERLLRSEYGMPPKRTCCDPLDVLVQTVLSQNTSDTNSSRAFESLRKRFRTWDALLDVPIREVENAIRAGGLARIKAARIQDIIKSIHKRYGKISLRLLCEMTPGQASQVLSEFKGVGPKTTCCVLLFGCGMNVFPVDTHIFRISKRLGLIKETATLEHAHRLWAEALPSGIAYSLHINLIEHGRRICRARTPLCSFCPLAVYCRYYHSSVS